MASCSSDDSFFCAASGSCVGKTSPDPYNEAVSLVSFFLPFSDRYRSLKSYSPRVTNDRADGFIALYLSVLLFMFDIVSYSDI